MTSSQDADIKNQDRLRQNSGPPTVTSRGGNLRRYATALFALLVLGLCVAAVWFFSRYTVSEETVVKIFEFPTFEYAEDPSGRSPFYSEYKGRELKLVQRDDTHFDFVFEPLEDHVAKVVFKNVDVSLMTPGLPSYAKEDQGLRRIALTDRQWNRQQSQFYIGSDDVEVTGGDGFETENLHIASLAKNCLNAGYWEVLLFTKTETGKQMYYQGWFTFPMGQYKRLWEQNTGLSYWDDLNFYRMEHWLDPAGNVLPMEKLRHVVSETTVDIHFDPDEPICFCGEQVRKRRTTQAPGVRTWGDIVAHRDEISFATFHPPGYYDVEKPWGNRFDLLAEFDGATHRKVESKLNGDLLDELELKFTSTQGEQSRLFIGGLDLATAPRLEPDEYPKGLYLPMGIGTPPFYQDYKVLMENPPQESPYYSFFLDQNDAWIDHHAMAVDGPVILRDANNSELLHLFLLSYERHLLVAHFTFQIPPVDQVLAGDDAAVGDEEAVAEAAKQPAMQRQSKNPSQRNKQKTKF